MSLDSLEKLFIEEAEAADQKLTELGEDGTNEAAAAAAP